MGSVIEWPFSVKAFAAHHFFRRPLHFFWLTYRDSIPDDVTMNVLFVHVENIILQERTLQITVRVFSKIKDGPDTFLIAHGTITPLCDGAVQIVSVPRFAHKIFPCNCATAFMPPLSIDPNAWPDCFVRPCRPEHFHVCNRSFFAGRFDGNWPQGTTSDEQKHINMKNCAPLVRVNQEIRDVALLYRMRRNALIYLQVPFLPTWYVPKCLKRSIV